MGVEYGEQRTEKSLPLRGRWQPKADGLGGL